MSAALKRLCPKPLCELSNHPTSIEIARFEDSLCRKDCWALAPPSVVVRVFSAVARIGYQNHKCTEAAFDSIVNILPTVSLLESRELLVSMKLLGARLTVPLETIAQLPSALFPFVDVPLSVGKFASTSDMRTCLQLLLRCDELALTTEDGNHVCNRLECLLRRVTPSFEVAVSVLTVCSKVSFNTAGLLKACFFLIDFVEPSLSLEMRACALELFGKFPEKPFLLLQKMETSVCRMVDQGRHSEAENSTLIELLQQKHLPCRTKLVLEFRSSLRMSDLEFDDVMFLSSFVAEVADQTFTDLLCARIFLEISNLTLSQCSCLMHELGTAAGRNVIISAEFVTRLKQQFYVLYSSEKNNESALSSLECFLVICTEHSISPFRFDDARRLVVLQKECMKCIWRTGDPQFLRVVSLLRALDALYPPFAQL